MGAAASQHTRHAKPLDRIDARRRCPEAIALALDDIPVQMIAADNLNRCLASSGVGPRRAARPTRRAPSIGRSRLSDRSFALVSGTISEHDNGKKPFSGRPRAACQCRVCSPARAATVPAAHSCYDPGKEVMLHDGA